MGFALEIPGLEVVAKLGSGGMGDVLLARKRSSHGFEKLLAVKTVRSDRIQDEQVRAMLLDEARLVARIDHPAVAQVHDIGEADGLLYLTMEFISGLTFRELIDRRIQLPPMVAARLVSEACWGLHAAHELTDLGGIKLGVVHRDVSPENLILTFSGQVKVLDFGIALMRERTAPITQVGFIRGKPSYMAPEQRHGGKIDRRTDIYALALVLCELITRKPVFETDVILDSEVEARVREARPPSLPPASLPPDLEAIVLRALAQDPEQRFSSARQMALALEAVLSAAGGETLQAFADRELAAARARHEMKLAAVLEAPRPRSTPAPRRTPTLPAAAPEAPAGTTAKLALEPAPASPVRRLRGVVIASAVVILALLAFAAARTIPPARSPAAAPRPPERATREVAAPEPERAPVLEPPPASEAPKPAAEVSRPKPKRAARSAPRKPVEPAPRLENGIVSEW